MDSKVVSAGLREELRPFLKEQGFTQFTGRKAWRVHEHHIDVIDFWSFNAYLAAVQRCTTYSFRIGLGIYFRFIPESYDRTASGHAPIGDRPDEAECHFRGRVIRGFEQREPLDRGIWYVDETGSNLAKCLQDARLQLQTIAMPWFARFGETREALRALGEDDPSDYLSEIGANPSPRRHYLTGYIALHLGDTELARARLVEAADAPIFERIRDRLLADAPQLAT